MEKIRSVSGAALRVVAQWMWLIASSLRSARCLEPCARKNCNSSQVGLSGEQSSRDTAKAPQALAQVADTACGPPFSQPRRKPDLNASLTYGAQAETQAMKQAGDYMAETDTRTETTGEALRLMVDEFGKIER